MFMFYEIITLKWKFTKNIFHRINLDWINLMIKCSTVLQEAMGEYYEICLGEYASITIIVPSLIRSDPLRGNRKKNSSQKSYLADLEYWT